MPVWSSNRTHPPADTLLSWGVLHKITANFTATLLCQKAFPTNPKGHIHPTTIFSRGHLEKIVTTFYNFSTGMVEPAQIASLPTDCTWRSPLPEFGCSSGFVRKLPVMLQISPPLGTGSSIFSLNMEEKVVKKKMKLHLQICMVSNPP